MINAPYTAFDLRPETFDGIGVCISENIYLFSVWDCIVSITHRWKSFINQIFIGENMSAFIDVCINYCHYCISLCVLYFAGFQLATAFNDSQYGGFTFRSAPTLAFAPSTKVAFVNFYIAIKRLMILKKHRANLLAHTPSSLISNARFAFNLFSRNATACLYHQVNHIKPRG